MKTTIFLCTVFLNASLNAATIRHDLKVRIEPSQSSLEAEDSIDLSEFAGETVFSLHKGLSPSVVTEGAELKEIDYKDNINIYGAAYNPADAVFTKYSIRLPQGVRTFRIRYGGVINHPPAPQAENYARAFSETPGLITADGVYLSGAAFWYPVFDGSLSTFKIETDLPGSLSRETEVKSPAIAPIGGSSGAKEQNLPEGYDCIAGGEQVSGPAKSGRTLSVWKAVSPQDEITLVCGKYKEYTAEGAGLKLQVFLREPDEELARKYLDAARQYTDMYSGLIGPYPYKKFAMVENFWETGYGFPSFTLLGSKVIRLPFILNSSYPHEILHNWWGGSVFVDYEKGNWCEGLTSYLADYLISESRGKGREYRMTALQKYADYVRSGKDFPLSEFRSRNSSASEAIGYGKTMMFYHMLRTSLGDEKFKAGLRDFYKKYKFKYASFEDLKRTFESQTGKTRLNGFFTQWIDRRGAPELGLKDVRLTRELDGSFGLEFTITQLQDGPAYQLDVPVAVQFENINQPRMLRLLMRKKEEMFQYSSTVRPARLEIDPEFDLFRKLNPLETPPTLSRLLGAEKPLIVLPSAASEANFKAYEAFALAWTKDNANLPEIKKDSELTDLPKDRQIWVLGAENRFAPAIAARLETYGARFSPVRAILNNQEFPPLSSAFVLADSNPENPVYSIGLILAGRPGKLPLLAAKLPHYGKYGYLVFDGEINSLAAGGWEVKNSPLAAVLSDAAPRQKYLTRAPLAAPVSVFSAERIKQNVFYLATGFEGRGQGEPGQEKAYRHIDRMFHRYGLTPLFEDGYTQEWKDSGRTFRNLAGAVKGSGRKDEYVVISAHYDTLPSEKGKVYSGANDNASGVALMLELAGYYSKHPAARSMIFAAFAGEEEDRLGSGYFVRNLPRSFGPQAKADGSAPAQTDGTNASDGRGEAAVTAAKINANINLDSVGRLDGGKLIFINSGSSDKWAPILRGAGFVTGTDYEASKLDLDSSDQRSFIDAGIPGIHALSGTNNDNHKVTDTADRLDYGGMVKEAEFIKEIADYLAGNSGLLTRPGAGTTAAQGAPSAERKASTGLVPSFDWPGKGVKADSVVEGSPLAKTGFKAGDVIIRINDVPTDDLLIYSRELKKFKPGDKVMLTYLSDSLEKTVEVELAAK